MLRRGTRSTILPGRLHLLFDHGAQDLRYAARRLRRAPGFVIATVLILTAGIGLNLTFFQLLNVAALRPPAVADIDTLVRFDRVTKQFSSNGIPYPATQFISRHNSVLSAVLTSTGGDVVWGDDADDRLRALYVSANWFTELGYDAANGRVFAETIDERPGADPVVIVSHDFWRTRLHGESVIGRTVAVNARPATIVGIAPRGFPGLRLDDTQIWLPIQQIDHFNPGSTLKDDWGSHSTQLYGRLRPGISLLAAKEGLRATILELSRLRPAEFEPDETWVPYSGRQGFLGPRQAAKLRALTLLITSLTVLVLVVACANLNGILLSRAIAEIRELSVRAALGASRWRIMRQQALESAILAGLGTLGGLLASYWAARVIAAYVELPPHVEFGLDWRVATAACALALVATLAIGIVPGWMVSRRDLIGGMKDGGHHTSRSLARAPFRLVLVASQIGGCCILLVVAGSTVRAVQRLLGSELGFEFAHVAVLDPSLSRYGITGDAARAYWAQVKERLAATPDIEQMALASHSPFAESASRSIYNDAPGLPVTAAHVEPAFFSLLRIPLVAGRSFAPQDEGTPVVIVSRRLAVAMYGGLDVLGKGFPRSHPQHTIIGVSADAPLVYVTATNVAELYFPVRRNDYSALVLLSTARNPERVLIPLREAARGSDPRVLPKTFLASTWFEQRLGGRRAASGAAGFTGLLALMLACVGLFGLVASNAAVRTKEIGIRRALGAPSGSVVRLLLRQLAIPMCIGLLTGAIGGVVAGKVLSGEPFYMPGIDLSTLAAALGIFTVTAMIAAIVPALRALGTNPLDALRHE